MEHKRVWSRDVQTIGKRKNFYLVMNKFENQETK